MYSKAVRYRGVLLYYVMLLFMCVDQEELCYGRCVLYSRNGSKQVLDILYEVDVANTGAHGEKSGARRSHGT